MGAERAERVEISGRSWISDEPGVYCFEAQIDGRAIVVRVTEDVAFDFLNAWTADRGKCLDVLRLHRRELGLAVEAKLRREHTAPRAAVVWSVSVWISLQGFALGGVV